MCCRQLKSVRLNEGLEKLGRHAFHYSAIESIGLPSTLKRVEAETFCSCMNLKNVEISEGVEYIGKYCFCQCVIREITLPSTLKEMGESSFDFCRNLRTVWVRKDCALDIRQYIKNVDVRYK